MQLVLLLFQAWFSLNVWPRILKRFLIISIVTVTVLTQLTLILALEIVSSKAFVGADLHLVSTEQTEPSRDH